MSAIAASILVTLAFASPPAAVDPFAGATRSEGPTAPPLTEPAAADDGSQAAPERSGEGLLITGWTLVGGGLTFLGGGLALHNADGWKDGDLTGIITVPAMITGGVAATVGTILVASGHARWAAAYNRWEYAGHRPDPRRASAARLIVPGSVLLSLGAAAGWSVMLTEAEETLVPASLAIAAGSALVITGAVRVSRRRRGRYARVRWAPTVRRTRKGTWTGGLVMRW